MTPTCCKIFYLYSFHKKVHNFLYFSLIFFITMTKSSKITLSTSIEISILMKDYWETITCTNFNCFTILFKVFNLCYSKCLRFFIFFWLTFKHNFIILYTKLTKFIWSSSKNFTKSGEDKSMICSTRYLFHFSLIEKATMLRNGIVTIATSFWIHFCFLENSAISVFTPHV